MFRDLPADAPGRAHRRGGAELFLRHTALRGAILLLANSIDKQPAVCRAASPTSDQRLEQ